MIFQFVNHNETILLKNQTKLHGLIWFGRFHNLVTPRSIHLLWLAHATGKKFATEKLHYEYQKKIKKNCCCIVQSATTTYILILLQ